MNDYTWWTLTFYEDDGKYSVRYEPVDDMAYGYGDTPNEAEIDLLGKLGAV